MLAWVRKKSSPAILRFSPPGSFFSSIASEASFHSRVWCSKNTAPVPSSSNESFGTSDPEMVAVPPRNCSALGWVEIGSDSFVS